MNDTDAASLPLVRTRDLPLLGPRPAQGLHRVRPGVYVDATQWETLPPWDRYRVRVRAVAASWDSPVLCLESAAASHAMPIFGEPRFIHLLDSGGKTRRYGDVVVHSRAHVDAQPTPSGGLATSPAVTALDLCRVLPPAFALATADAVLRSLAEVGESLDFSAAGRAQENRRGVRQLDWVQQRASPTPESVGESVSLAVLEWLGFARPELQVSFDYDGFHDRGDFYFREQRAIAESDGYGKYDADDVAAAKAHFIAEKRREDRLRSHGHGFARWDWGDTMRADPVGRALHRAGVQPSGPRQAALLATLRHNPRSLPPIPRATASARRMAS